MGRLAVLISDAGPTCSSMPSPRQLDAEIVAVISDRPTPWD